MTEYEKAPPETPFVSEDEEKRRDLRVPLRVIRVEGLEPAGREIFFGYASNISKSGLFIQTVSPREIGTRVKLRFQLPSTKETIQCAAEVKWAQHFAEKGSSPGMGLQFVEISPEALASVEKFVGAKENPS